MNPIVLISETGDRFRFPDAEAAIMHLRRATNHRYTIHASDQDYAAIRHELVDLPNEDDLAAIGGYQRWYGGNEDDSEVSEMISMARARIERREQWLQRGEGAG